MIPIAPLWGFFCFVRDKSTTPLSLDQYFFLMEALHKVDSRNWQSAEALLKFTKIFWLNDDRFSRQYDFYFKNFFDWEAYHLDLQQNPDPARPNTVENIKDIDGQPGSSASNIGSAEKETINPNINQVQNAEAEKMVDFELLISDVNSSMPLEETIAPRFSHDFIMNDLAILPFDSRNFVQRLRRKVETAEQVKSDTLDLVAMIESYSKLRYLDDLVYEKEDASHSNVVLLADSYGSMVAYEYLEKHLATGFRQIPYCDFQHYFFYNLPDENTEDTHYQLKHAGKGAKILNTKTQNWTQNTWFFIFSDAGAHSGLVNRDRISRTLKMWRYFNQISAFTYWINPVPFKYLNDCTAKRLQMTIPMLNPDEKSLNKMILTAKSNR